MKKNGGGKTGKAPSPKPQAARLSPLPFLRDTSATAVQPTISAKAIDQFLKEHRVKRERIYARAREIVMEEIKKKGLTDSFYLYDIADVHDRITIWRQFLPRVELWYAAKVNDDVETFKALIRRGCGFDVASVKEFSTVLALGVDPKKLIFANPVKEEYQLEGARKLGVSKMTFDSVEELQKIKKYYPEAECVIRLAVDNTTAVYNLNEKFGVPMKDVPVILKEGKRLGMRIKGVAFHTGSGGVTIVSYEQSLRNARKVFDMAESIGLEPMDFLDLGGGFTLIHAEKIKNFPYVAPLIGKLLDDLFPSRQVQVIAEPGRYVMESACYLLTRIIGQKVMGDGKRHYYINNGLYQGYMVKQFGEDMF